MSDPLRLVWDALANGGYGPHGQQHDFRARCPGHDGDNQSSLHVSDNGFGAALVWCFARRCTEEQITAALGLTVADLFPAGHQRARRRHLHDARRSEFTGSARTAANVLLAVAQLNVDYRVEIVADCPYCRAPNASLTVASWFPHALVQCASGCGVREFTEALANRVEGGKAA